jgi:DNA-binding NtrC family response regulator
MISPSPSINGSNQTLERSLNAGSPTALMKTLRRPNLLIATIDSEVRNSLFELLGTYAVHTIWAKGMGEIKSSLAGENVAACFCSFWLLDGTYRDILRYVKRQQAEIPLIVLCPQACSQEHQEYLAALNIHAFDYICYPYRREDLEKVLPAALPSRVRPTEMTVRPGGASHSHFASSASRRAT